jgi:hypothetical protein
MALLQNNYIRQSAELLELRNSLKQIIGLCYLLPETLRRRDDFIQE